jgi:hypothetical protein
MRPSHEVVPSALVYHKHTSASEMLSGVPDLYWVPFQEHPDGSRLVHVRWYQQLSYVKHHSMSLYTTINYNPVLYCFYNKTARLS